MARPRNLVPTYRKHSSGRGAVSVYRADGLRVEVLLPGPFGSDESKAEYERILILQQHFVSDLFVSSMP